MQPQTALIAPLAGSFHRGWKIPRSHGLGLAAKLVPLTEIWHPLPGQGMAGVLTAQGSLPQLLCRNGRGHQDYLVINRRWTSQKSQGGRVGKQRACAVAREHHLRFSICISCRFKHVQLGLQTASRQLSAAARTRGVLQNRADS